MWNHLQRQRVLKQIAIYWPKGGGGAATGVGEGGGWGDSVDVAEDQDESSLALTSVVSPIGYSRTRRFSEDECCMKATFMWDQLSLLSVSLSIPKTMTFSTPTKGLDTTWSNRSVKLAFEVAASWILSIRGHIVVKRYTTGYHIRGFMSSFINAFLWSTSALYIPSQLFICLLIVIKMYE